LGERRLLWLWQAGLVAQRIEVQAHDGNDLFRLHQVGPKSGVHGESVDERVRHRAKRFSHATDATPQAGS